MNAKPTILLILSLTTAAFAAAGEPNEPNDATRELKFEMSTNVHAWTLHETVEGKTNVYYNPGTIRPKYMAEVILPRYRDPIDRLHYLARVKESPVAQKLSQDQKDFLAHGLAAWVDPHTDNVPEHSTLKFYAVSEEDAKTMVLALLDSFATERRESYDEQERTLQERKQERERMQTRLSESEKRRQDIDARYDQHKEAAHPSLDDDEAVHTAKEVVLQMDKEGNQLDIELAGIRAKLKVIEAYLSKRNTVEIAEHLEAMRVDLEIELSSLEARRKAIERIHATEQEFCRLYRERQELHRTIPPLRGALDRCNQTIRNLTNKLEYLAHGPMRPEIFENKVTIYPIEEADSHN